MSAPQENDRVIKNFVVDISLYISSFMFSILITTWTFNAIKERRGYPSAYSKVNVVLSSLCVFSLQMIHAFQNAGFIFMEQNYWSCKYWLCISRLMFCLSALTILQIFIEVSMTNLGKRGLVRSNGSRRHGIIKWPNVREMYTPLRLFLIVWFFVLILPILGISTTQFLPSELDKDGNIIAKSRCDKVHLFDSRVIDFFYELCLWTMISFLPSIVMVVVIYDWGFRIEFLYIIKPIPSGLKHQVRRIRLAFLNMCLFVMLWVPMGLVLVLRPNKSEVGPRNFKTNTFSITILIVRFLFMLQISIQPTIFMYAHFEIEGRKWLANLCGNKENTEIKNESYLVMETVDPSDQNSSTKNDVKSVPLDPNSNCFF